MKLIPLADRVVLKQVKAEEKTKSGLILASAAQEKPEIFEVIEVGPGGVVDGKEVEMYVKVADKVIINKYVGTEVTEEAIDKVKNKKTKEGGKSNEQKTKTTRSSRNKE